MKRIKGIEIPISIAVSYTLISIANAVLNLLSGREGNSNWNDIIMLLWTSAAVFILSIHPLFDEWPPLLMICVQYLIAAGLVLLTVYISGFFTEVSKEGYKDAVISFTIPYMIGAAVYYISVFRTAKRQDKIMQEINGVLENRKKQDKI